MSYTCLMYHIVFSTKDRRPLLRGPDKARLIEYVGGIVRGLKGTMLGADGGEDHLHLAAMVSPAVAVSEFVKTVKGRSSAWAHESMPQWAGFGWQDGYAGFTVSRSVMPSVLRYIAGQEQHHRRLSFEDEVRMLLEKHGVAYDPKYVC